MALRELRRARRDRDRRRLSATWAVVPDTLAAYLLFTVLHDALHGTAHSSRAVSGALGRVCGTVLTLAWPLFRAVHLAHHAHLNDCRAA